MKDTAEDLTNGTAKAMPEDAEKDAARSERAAFYAEEIIKDAKGQILLHMPYLAEAVLHLRAADSAALIAKVPARKSDRGADSRGISFVTGENGEADETDKTDKTDKTNKRDETPQRMFRFGTDGRRLFYDPFHVITIYKAEENGFTRDFMHSLLHCLFRHPFPDERTALPGNRELWDLACDIAVEALIGELEQDFLTCPRQGEQQAMLHLLEAEIGKPLGAERIYRWLREKSFSPEEIRTERMHFLGDQHGLWYTSAQGQMLLPEEITEEWEDLARKTELLMEEMDEENALSARLGTIHRRKIPYRAFLRKFVNQREILKNADEFDYVYYTYGLSLYGNIPLIEPLEYKEDDRIRTIAVAIDTSGSVQGEAVQSFIEHTCSILFDEALIADAMKIHLIQCDDRIREDTLIGSRQELAAYMQTTTVKGLGQTDFRPVFTYLGGLIAEGKIRDFQGLLYFTDGQGIFPAKAPAFPTAFILNREDAQVPEWAARYILG